MNFMQKIAKQNYVEAKVLLIFLLFSAEKYSPLPVVYVLGEDEDHSVDQ